MSFMNHCGGFGEGLYQLTVCVWAAVYQGGVWAVV